MAKASMATKVRKYMVKHPNATVPQIMEATGAGKQQVYNIRWAVNKAKAGKADIIRAHYGAIKKARVGASVAAPKPAEKAEAPTNQGELRTVMRMVITDNVNSPAHYKVGGIETIDFIEAKNLGYNLGNVVKYITRADHKGNRSEDLLKARWYLNREIAKLSGETK